MLTEQQLNERKNYMGGSDVAAILGYSKWKTPIDVFLEKTTDYKRFEENKNKLAKDIGDALEGIIIDDYCQSNDIKCVKNHELKHKCFPFVVGHPDAIIIKNNENEFDYILEIKTAYAKSEEWGEQRTDQMPIDYLYQVAFYCWISEVEKCVLLVYFKNTGTVEEYIYNRNEIIEKEMSEKLPEFWGKYVLKNEMPPAIRAKDISHVYKTISTIKLDVEKHQLINVMEQYKELSDNIKDFERKKEELREKIVLELGGYGKIFSWDNENIGSFSNQLSKRLDVDKIKKEYPQVYETCLKESYSQVLRIK